MGAFDRGIALHPNKASLWSFKAKTLERQGKLDEALEAIRKSVDLYPKEHSGRRFTLARLSERSGLLEEALGEYIVAFRLSPERSEIHRRLSRLLRDIGEHADIADDIRKLREFLEGEVSADVGHAYVYHLLSQCILRDEDSVGLERARSLVNLALEKTRTHPESLATYAELELRSGTPAGAVLALEQALRLPQASRSLVERLREARKRLDVPSYASADALLVALVRSEAGHDLLDEALSRGNEVRDARVASYLRGRLAQFAGNLAGARQTFARLAENLETHSEPFLRLAETLKSLKRPDEAELWLRRGIDSIAENRELWNAWMLVGLEDLELSPQALLSDFPEGKRGDTDVNETSVRKRGADPSADIRWLLAQLSAGDTIRFNCGGNDYTDKDGNVWGRDRFFWGGWVAHRSIRSGT